MDGLITYVVNIVSLGGTYALLALGLAVVFSVLRLINFAHGELMTLAGYTLLAGILLGVPFWAAVLAAVFVGGLAAVATAFRSVRNANAATLLMTSFAVAMLLQVIFQNFISARGQAVPVPSLFTGSIPIANAQISVIQAISTVTSLVWVDSCSSPSDSSLSRHSSIEVNGAGPSGRRLTTSRRCDLWGSGRHG